MDKLIQSPHFTVWQLIRLYWQSQHRLYAYGMYAVLVVLTISVVCAELALNYWYNYFYNALQLYEVHTAVMLLILFFGIAFLYILLFLARYFIWQIFGLRWRRWLTEQVMGRWFEKRGYYYLETFDEKTDNPDQRIQDDAGSLVANSLDLSITLLGNILTVIGFSYVLWNISGDEIAIPIFNFTIHIHGYLMWIAVIYSLVGTLFTFKIGRPLIGLNFEQQRREATFRFAAIDLRQHAEHVALYRGEPHQKRVLRDLFNSVLENAYAIIIRQTKLLSYTAAYGQLAVALPLIVIIPLYFKKVIMLGGMMQSLRAFGSIQDALSFIVNSYTQIAQWRATGQRLTTFLNHLTEIEDSVEKQSALITSTQPENAITTNHLTIKTPRDELLLQNVDRSFQHGQNYLLKGPSGIGKSTFLRAIAGIWPFAAGEIILPDKKNIMFLSQKPYMPIGSLAEAIAFPDKGLPADFVVRMEEVLRDCHLDNLIPRLYETASWSEQLSPGEQQRIAFARILLHKPDWAFLDESTSMIDLANEAHLYKTLKEKLPNCSLVSIAHRPTLDSFHAHIIDMSQYTQQKRA